MALLKFILVFLIASCSDDPGAARTQPGNNPSVGGADQGAKSLAGDWSGVMQAKDGTTLIGNPASATLSFELDKTFSLKSADTAAASGKYEVFGDNITIFFNVEKSSISNFGIAGSRQSMTYQWLGSDMTLKSNSIDLKLKRQSGRVDATPSSGGSKTFIGSWVCSEGSERNWLLNIRDSSVEGAVTDGQTPAMTFSGVVNHEQGDLQRALVRITDSNSSSSVGYQFRILRTDDKTLRMGKLPSGQQSELSVTSWIDCKAK